MSELDDRRLDELLAGHLSRELDARVGRAADTFAARAGRQHHHRALSWPVAAGITAIAAALAMAFILHRPSTNTQIAKPVPITQPRPDESLSDQPFVERSVSWQTTDEGTVLLWDNTPARQVRQLAYEQIRWRDPVRNMDMEITIPHERVIYVEMEVY